MNRFENDLSKGKVVPQLIKFAIPFVISNLIQCLYSVADMVIVGNFAGTAAMSGVNLGGSLSFILTFVMFGFATGGTVMIGQYLPGNKRKDMKETVATMFIFLMVLAVVLSALMIIFNRQLLSLINTPEEAMNEAYNYLLISAIGFPFVSGYNSLSAVMRGMGDSKRPLVFVTISCVTNIVLDLVAVAVLHWGAAGAALATIISQALSMLLCIIYLKRNDFVFDFKLKSFRISGEKLKMILKLGWPQALQNVLTSVSFLVLTAIVNTWGVAASAAVGAVGKFNSFGILPALAMSAAVSAMSAHNIGAREYKRATQTMWTGMALGFAMSVLVFIVSQLWPGQIIGLFTSDPAVIEAGAIYLRAIAYDFLLVPIMVCFNGLYIGGGHTMISLVNGCISAILVRIPLGYIFGLVLDMGLYGIGIGAPIATAVSILVAVIYFLTGRWKNPVVLKGTADTANELTTTEGTT